MMKSFFGSIVLAVALAMALAGHAQANTPMVMYATDTANKFYQVDMQTGQCATVGTIAATSPPNCPQPDPIVGMVYKGGLLLALDSSGRLYQFKAASPGSANFMRDTGIRSTNNCTPMDFTIFHGSFADYYYAIAIRPGGVGTELFQVDPYGSSTDLGYVCPDNQMSLSTYNGLLYAASTTASWFSEPATGATATLLSLDGGTWMSLTTDRSTPTLWGLDIGNRKTIAQVNPANGHPTINPSVTASVPLFVICSSYD